jgi:hypothetical protein
MTRSSATLSIFAEPSRSREKPSAFAVSALVHVAAVSFGYFALTHVPRIQDPDLLTHYTVRALEFHRVDASSSDFPRFPASSAEKIRYPSPEVVRQVSAQLRPGLNEAMNSFLGATAGRLTLIQPEIRTRLSFAEQVPVPTMMIWTPDPIFHKRIVPSRPSPASGASAISSLELPNREIKPAENPIAPTDVASRTDALAAGTTSPIVMHLANQQQRAPATLSEPLLPPAPAAVLSLSDVRMDQGAVYLPPVNDVATSAGRGSRIAEVGSGIQAMASQAKSAEHSGENNSALDGHQPALEHIVLPRDGKFSFVVVGHSVTDDYPEIPDIWANRMAYTAFLHVGLKKNWILQYSITRTAEMAGAASGSRLEAPWPYDIMRPSLMSRDINADALMIHGILNQDGRLESLAIPFPANFRYASFVLYALRQWQFRPARQNGRPTAVEVLLIIPEDWD